LKSGETAKFQVGVHFNKGIIEIGFDFLVGDKRLKKTYWSKEIELKQPKIYKRRRA
jgi:hypothetical protein